MPVETKIIDGVQVEIQPHPIVEGWYVARAGALNKCLFTGYAGQPDDGELFQLVRKYKEKFHADSRMVQ